MLSPRTLVTVCVLIFAVSGALAWHFFPRHNPPVPVDKDQEQREARAAIRLVELKDESLAALENRDFREAEPQLLDLATVGIGEPIGSRNWLINRLCLVGTIDKAKDIQAYADAIERCRTALNLEWNLEREGPVRYYLASRIEFLGQNFPKELEDLHTGAGRGQDSPLMWHTLYMAERNIADETIRADGENALKTLYELIPDNLYVLLEWMGVQARLKDETIVSTLDRARGRLLPFLGDVPASTPIAPAQAITEASSAAKKEDWAAVARNVTALSRVGALQPAVRNDKWRVDRGMQWLIKTDYSDKFYRERGFDRVLPKQSAPIHFREVPLKGPLADLNDVREARCVDCDLAGRPEIAVLRNSSVEIYGRTGTRDDWKKIAAARLPSSGFEHLIAADLDVPGAAPTPDLLVFGPAGVLVVENRVDAKAQTGSLRPIGSRTLMEKTKGAQSVLAIDLDHDGALDLVVLRTPTEGATGSESAAVSVWRNLGRMEFADVTPRSGLSQKSRNQPASTAPVGACSLAAIDFNHDCDMDVLLAAGGLATSGAEFLQGAGEGRFRRQPLQPDNPVFRSATALSVLDGDNNGCCDVLAAGPSGMALLQTSSTQPGEAKTLRVETVSDFPANQLLVLDFDNDGCQDVIGWNGDAVLCLHGTGNGRFQTAADILPASLHAIKSADSGDFDADGDIDLLLVTPESGGGRLHLLENDGGNRNNWIDVSLSGGSGQADGRKPPAFGVGSLLQLKTGVVCQSRIVAGPVTHFGLGKLESADFLRIVWPTGIPADILQPAKNRLVRSSPPPSGWR